MIDFQHFDIGDHRLPCPACARGPKDRTLGVTIDPEGGVAHCFRCNHIESWKRGRIEIHRHAKARSAPVARTKRETLSDYGRELWAACGPTDGLARRYLEARRCALPPEDGHLRFHSALKHPSGYVGPALVGLVTDALTGDPISLHRTWIRADGKKADVDTPRLLLGGHRKQGGVIRLWPDDFVTAGLMVGEGVETVLAAARHYRPAWSAIDAGNLEKLPVLPGIEFLVIAADHDEAGLKAANKCADCWATAGVEVHVLAPIRARADWNDVEQVAA